MMPNPADTPDADDLRAARLLQQALARPGEILEIEPSSPPQPVRPFVRQGTGRLSPAMKTAALTGSQRVQPFSAKPVSFGKAVSPPTK